MQRSLPRRLLASLLIGVMLSAAAGLAVARELAVDPDEMIEVEIATVGVAGAMGPPVVLLREPGGEDVIPIFIGPNEAEAILRALRGDRPRRPLTHELLNDVIDGLDANLARVYVDALQENTFLGMLELEIDGRDAPVRIDSRPSDALALALQAGATIHVAPEVREAARQIDYEGLEDSVVAALGITVTRVSDDLRDALGLPDDDGLLVSDVSGAAEEAGMAPGALLLEVNDQVPSSPMNFLELVRDTPADEEAQLRYWQEGEVHDITLSTDVPTPRPRGRGAPESDEEPGIRL
ncbi:bifunctional nuclease family protein [Halomonas sp. ML-15]|uniref:bifunctional nuclease domain-containing protein n=1 Tax=Halomonas sp. ML-15 TaxID=2773305 RepID=UPI0017477C07|nr:bifunctional nuclease domain-containing protein [Halomonas sp. ML-15]MBD3894726.1 bifunctional nuclease family protein [Halomonas sp. ML-15]